MCSYLHRLCVWYVDVDTVEATLGGGNKGKHILDWPGSGWHIMGNSGSLPDVRLVTTSLLWPSKTTSWLLQAALHTNIIIL